MTSLSPYEPLKVDNEDLVFTLETIVEKFGEQMAPYALGLCQHLAAAFTRIQVLEMYYGLGFRVLGKSPRSRSTLCISMKTC